MPFPFIPVIMALGSIVSGIVGARAQRKQGKELAQFQADANEGYLNKQLEYNTPANQMQRFQDAGLNPHLIYGQGNPGNQSAPLQYPEVKGADMQSMLSQFLPMLNQSMLAQSQVEVNDARIRKTGFDIQLNKLQQAVLAKNPLFDEVGFKAIIDSLKATAESKQSESALKGLEADFYKMQGIGRHGVGSMMDYKLFKELDLLDQRFRLGEVDTQIKAQILNSKEFQNAILEVQKKFMTDGQITPENIRQFIMLLLTKLL